METTTAFDLNQAIISWRNELAQSPAFLSENLEELEMHLRDSIAMLENGGLSEEESFIIATRRLGSCSAIAKEFGQVNRKLVWLDRGLWMLIGIQLWMLVFGFSGSMAQSIMFSIVKRWHVLQTDGSTMPLVFLAIGQVLCLGGMCLLCFWLLGRRNETLLHWSRKFIARRRGLMFATLVACSASISIPGVRFAMNALHSMSLRVDEFGRFALLQQWSGLILLAVQPAVLVALTVFVVRRRLSVSKA